MKSAGSWDTKERKTEITRKFVQKTPALAVAMLVAAGWLLSVVGQTGQVRKPNIIFILADDLGWGDLSVYGHELLKTPNLDRLPEQGTLFTQF